MNIEQIVLPLIRQIGKRPVLSKNLFRFAKWGDPFTPQRFSWPYPIYDKMTADGPVIYSRAYQQWFVSGYDEVLEVLRSPNVSTEAVAQRMLSVSPYTKLSDTARANFSTWLILTDPPDHTRLRGAVSRAFAPRRIAGYEPRVRTIVDQLLADAADDPNPDVVASFTAGLPIYVIAELLGLPPDRWEWLRAASAEIGGLLEAMRAFDPASMNRRFADLDETFTALIEQRRGEPRDDLISALVADGDDRLSTDEVVAMIALLMFAGHETTTGLLGNSIVALANFPDQRALLRSTPELIDNAVEELLRFDTTAQFSARNTIGPVEVGDTTIPAGSNLALMIGAANRDTRKWADADLLRLDRPDPKSISFGHGIHHCLGAALARLEMRVAIPAFLDAYGDYTVDLDTAVWKRSHTLRAPTSLRLRKG